MLDFLSTHSRTRRVLIAIVAIAFVVLLLRAALPLLATRYVNAHLEQMGDYRGHVADIDLALFRGAGTFHELIIVKRGAQTEEPFLVLPRAEVSIDWSSLLDGSIVGEIEMREPVVNLVQGERDDDTQLGAGVDWPAELDQVLPFNVNRAEVTGGRVTFRAPGIDTADSLTLREIRFLVTNLTNIEGRDEPTFADFRMDALFPPDSPLSLKGRLNPNAGQPTFDVDLTLERAPLAEVNPWLRTFLNADAESGLFFMYAELAAAEGRFKGYIRPILENADVFSLEEPSRNPLQKAWEALLEIVSNILENPEEEQVATQIPFSGRLENPDAGVLAAGVNLLRNAFVAAFLHALEGTVTIEDLQSGKKQEQRDADEDDG